MQYRGLSKFFHRYREARSLLLAKFNLSSNLYQCTMGDKEYLGGKWLRKQFQKKNFLTDLKFFECNITNN